MAYNPNSYFDLAPEGRRGFWRYLGGLVLIIIIFGILSAVLGMLAGIVAVVSGVNFTPDSVNEIKVWANLSPDQDGLALFICVIFMVSFVALLVANLLVARFLHGQPLRTLFTARPKFAYGRLFGSALVIMIMAAIGLAADYTMNPASYEVILDWERFLPFLIVGVLFIPLQSLSEEVLFRGYITQGVSAVTGVLAIRLAVPAILFTMLHGANAVWAAGGIWIVLTFLTMALYLGYITWVSNGLEVASGFHIGNNLFALLVVSSPLGDAPFATVLFSDQIDFTVGYFMLLPTLAVHYLVVRWLGYLKA